MRWLVRAPHCARACRRPPEARGARAAPLLGLTTARISFFSASERASHRLRWHLHRSPRSHLHCAAFFWSTEAISPSSGAASSSRVARARARARPRLVRSHCQELTVEIRALEREIGERVSTLAPSLLSICGCGALTAAKIVRRDGEHRALPQRRCVRSSQRHGTAPCLFCRTAASSPQSNGNRQLNAALYRIALTQKQWHPQAQALIARRRAQGDSSRGALRVLKRRLSDVVYRALLRCADRAASCRLTEERVAFGAATASLLGCLASARHPRSLGGVAAATTPATTRRRWQRPTRRG